MVDHSEPLREFSPEEETAEDHNIVSPSGGEFQRSKT